MGEVLDADRLTWTMTHPPHKTMITGTARWSCVVCGASVDDPGCARQAPVGVVHRAGCAARATEMGLRVRGVSVEVARG